jgi:hypothetical protein
MKDKSKKLSVNSRLPEEVVHRWHEFALQKRMNKENALAEIIIKGTANRRGK